MQLSISLFVSGDFLSNEEQKVIKAQIDLLNVILEEPNIIPEEIILQQLMDSKGLQEFQKSILGDFSP